LLYTVFQVGTRRNDLSVGRKHRRVTLVAYIIAQRHSPSDLSTIVEVGTYIREYNTTRREELVPYNTLPFLDYVSLTSIVVRAPSKSKCDNPFRLTLAKIIIKIDTPTALFGNHAFTFRIGIRYMTYVSRHQGMEFFRVFLNSSTNLVDCLVD